MLSVGTRVYLRRAVDRWPDFEVPAYATGTVLAFEDVIRVKLDAPPPGAAQWDGELHFYQKQVPGHTEEFLDVVRPIGCICCAHCGGSYCNVPPIAPGIFYPGQGIEPLQGTNGLCCDGGQG